MVKCSMRYVGQFATRAEVLDIALRRPCAKTNVTGLCPYVLGHSTQFIRSFGQGHLLLDQRRVG